MCVTKKKYFYVQTCRLHVREHHNSMQYVRVNASDALIYPHVIIINGSRLTFDTRLADVAVGLAHRAKWRGPA